MRAATRIAVSSAKIGAGTAAIRTTAKKIISGAVAALKITPVKDGVASDAGASIDNLKTVTTELSATLIENGSTPDELGTPVITSTAGEVTTSATDAKSGVAPRLDPHVRIPSGASTVIIDAREIRDDGTESPIFSNTTRDLSTAMNAAGDGSKETLITSHMHFSEAAYDLLMTRARDLIFAGKIFKKDFVVWAGYSDKNTTRDFESMTKFGFLHKKEKWDNLMRELASDKKALLLDLMSPPVTGAIIRNGAGRDEDNSYRA